MSDHIVTELDAREMAELRAALLEGTFTAAAGDLGRALMSAYVMWHARMGALASATPAHAVHK